MAARPGSRSGGRPGSAARPPMGPGAAAGRPPGTATRLTTGQAPGTAQRGGAMAGGGIALSGAQVHVADRPITQQGLGGVKTGAQRMQRMVQDRTYWIGALRTKINELTSEVGKLTQEITTASDDQGNYLAYEKRAEALANEIKNLQGELGDYNTLVDKLTTEESITDIQMDVDDLKTQNDKEARALDTLFEQKKVKEDQIHQVEVELRQEKSMTDNLISDMKPEMRQKYSHLKDTNEHLLRQMEQAQQQLDQLNVKKAELEEELSMSPVKQEAVRLYEQLAELELKRDALLVEMQAKGTPQEEREKLLKVVKEDNQEIAMMERQSTEIQEKLAGLQSEIQQLDMDIEENQGERNQKYKELKKREESMDDFLGNFEETKAQELEKTSRLQSDIVLILEHLSRNLARFGNLPTPAELTNMKDDLVFKEGEKEKAIGTTSGLAGETEKLAQDLIKVEQLESKITTELDLLNKKIGTMTEEMELYSDLDKLRSDAETRKKKLGEDKIVLHKRREMFKKSMQQLTSQYEALKATMNENETFAQLGNLERKWQHHEQNNFVMKEFIAAKSQECDFRPIAKTVSNMIGDYNTQMQGGKPTMG